MMRKNSRQPQQPTPEQQMGLSQKDIQDDLASFGGVRRPNMRTRLKDLIRDGRGWFVPDEDMRELFAFCIEPGMPFPRAPFAGMTADEIADAFADEHLYSQPSSASNLGGGNGK